MSDILKQKFLKCLETETDIDNGLYKSEEEKTVCRRMVEEMPSDDLVAQAAYTSYAYWYLSLLSSQNNDDNENSNSISISISEETKIGMAMREARRHLSYNNGDYQSALKGFIESCEWRKQENIDLLRVCFDVAANKDKDSDTPPINNLNLTPEDRKRCEEMATIIREDMKMQYVVMRGYDKEQRAIMIKYPRIKTGTTQEGYTMAMLYMADRSVAATEYLSGGKQERSLAVFDYNGFESSNSPPFTMQASAATTVQKHFPERLQVVVFVTPPFWLRTLLNMITPILSSTITDRIKHATGVEEKEPIFGAMIDPEGATPLLLKDGKLDTPMSLKHFLEDVPFFCLYDDVKCEHPIEPEEQVMHDTQLKEDEPNNGTSLLQSVSSSVGSVASSVGSLW